MHVRTATHKKRVSKGDIQGNLSKKKLCYLEFTVLTFQALTTQPPASKRYWRKLTLAVIAAVAITVFLTAQIVNVTQANSSNPNMGGYSPGPQTQEVLSGQITLNPKGSYLTGFNVPDAAKNVVLQGNYTIVKNSTHNAAVITIWSQQEFLNYFACKNAIPCYNKDMIPMTSDNLNITLTSGNYLVLISGAGVDTEILEAQIELTFTI